MRKRLEATEKRSTIIGIKVKQETREKLQYIAEREGMTLSTWINSKLTEEINKYFSYAKIEWEKIPTEERRNNGTIFK